MKTLTLPETRIKLEVPDSFYYHDDGLVSSLDVQTAKLEKQYNLRVKFKHYHLAFEGTFLARLYKKWCYNFSVPMMVGCNAYFYPPPYHSLEEALREGGSVNSHTYILDILGMQEMSFYRGHEETHALLDVKKLNALKKVLAEIDVRSDSLDSLPIEDICNIGGFYALIMRHPNAQFTLTLRDKLEKTSELWSKWLKENSALVG